MGERCLRDSVGREIRYLRLSVTAQCGLRCAYCRPEKGVGSLFQKKTPDPFFDPFFTGEEIEELVRYLVTHCGLRKVRLTGGEPTERPDLLMIIRRLAQVPGLRELAMTTNGLTLSRQARDLAAAGLHRINVSLDALDDAVFARIAGAPVVERVIAGIDAALRAGLTPVKLNTVVLRGINDGELPGLVEFAAARGLEIRFIELMPMGPLAGRWSERFVAADEMRARLADIVADWEPIGAETADADSPQRFRARLKDGRWLRIGFISAMSAPFCAACDRMRVTADGTLYPCLMGPPAGSLLPALRPRLDAERLEELLAAGLSVKRPAHLQAGMSVMTEIGG